jgi:hypothetical protein
MSRTYKQLPTDAALSDQQDALWGQYYAEEAAARGLKAGASLDTFQGVTIPAITTRYANAYKLSGQPGGVVELDDRAQAWNGRVQTVNGKPVPIDAVGVAEQALPQAFQDVIGVKPAAVVSNLTDAKEMGA